MRLEHKVALVTGGSRSIGRAIALGYVSEGARVAISYRQHADAADQVVKDASKAGGQVVAFQADTSQKSDVDALVAATVETFGRLDVLVNNAGMLRRSPFLEISEAEWDEVLDTNLKGYFLCSQAAARQMVLQNSGVIVNISSANQDIASMNVAHYCCSKGGVRMLTRQLALELAQYGIRANAIAPGLIETDLNRADLAVAEFRESRLRRLPLKRIGVPEDVVGAAIFLASDESSLATGSTIYLDAGQTIS